MLVRRCLTPLLLLAASAAGAKTCAECAGKTCLLEGSVSLTGGATSVALSLCYYDASSAPAITFSLSAMPSCDVNSVLMPRVKALATNTTTTSGLCTKTSADPCPVVATLQSPIDWAIALQAKSTVNTLLASIDQSSSDVVKVATFSTETAPAVTSAETAVTACGSNIPVSGNRFSNLDACNVVQVCRGPVGASTCVVSEAGGSLRNVTASSSSQVVFLSMAKPFGCDAISANSFLYVQITVGDADASGLTKVAKIGALTTSTRFTAYPPAVGATTLSLAGDVCAGTDASFSLSPNATSLPASTASSGNTTLTLATPWTASSAAILNYTLCGVSVARSIIESGSSLSITPAAMAVPSTSLLANVAVTGAGFSSGSVNCTVVAAKGTQTTTFTTCACTATSTTNLTLSCSNSLADYVGYTLALVLANGANPVTIGSVCDAAQCATSIITGAPEGDQTAGLPGGWIAGIAIVVIAILGFILECSLHRKRFRRDQQANRTQYVETHNAA
ncbi:hypothetical protein SPRG_05239 [Saprolegnia parasitica CBS 223.65]|uniref:IPT/TIG domain-containing protein n=1 Tax=Saprolegnia parasitica (strain CBS 223.65) TaxID=695850 RepID=A0A067CHP7_SAPPC|nr:hypothetical protein SPRG_05239 [Saprolegnia parasitica CBS 223.65]KDO30048.1 hypothetical protein SPRG_05239 [Saprolegnia parasitica CBS 223.65]|eukprot:XP_012199229.1 hypothetical protein SPRG_05239 [Saprolegnia parasitica CBS 223.65]